MWLASLFGKSMIATFSRALATYSRGTTLVNIRSVAAVTASHTNVLCTSRTMATSNEQRNLGNVFDDNELQAYIGDMKTLIMEDVLLKCTDRDAKVVNFKQPEQLRNLLNVDIGKEPTSHQDLLELCKTVIEYSVKTGSPRFFNQLYSGLNAYGMTGAWLTEALNTNIHTFEVAPAFIVIEKYVFEKLCSIVGFSAGDGIFCPGGSFSNIMAMNLARHKRCPELKTTGMYNMKRMKVYTSVEAHYSAVKGASFLGLGSDSVVKISTDEGGRMKPGDLEQQIVSDLKKGEDPVFVIATAGTTVLGAYDPLKPLADICRKYNIWLHCDACWGGGVLLSEKHKHLMSGIERTDSVSWNLHKMTAAPLQCTALLIKRKGMLEECYRYRAEYLFQPDKCYDVSYDIGDKTVQCGRKVDALKLWLMWKALGDDGMTAIVDRAFDNARYLTEKLRTTEGFRLVIPEFECTNINFWYIPKSLRGQEETPEWWEKLSKVAPQIKERMVCEGTMLIGYTPLSPKGFVNFFRIIIGNAACNYSDMDFVINEMERLGHDL